MSKTLSSVLYSIIPFRFYLQDAFLSYIILARKGGYMYKEKVIIRAYGNKPLIRYTCGMNEKAVYITNEDSKHVIGFHKEDVFRYDEGLAKKIEKGNIKSWDWNDPKLIIFSN